MSHQHISAGLYLTGWQVRAVLAGRKTQHRLCEPIRDVPAELYVKEAWAPAADAEDDWRTHLDRCVRGVVGQWPDRPPLHYQADGGDPWVTRWRSGRRMPRAAARIRLHVTGVWDEPLGEVTHDGALAEGVEAVSYSNIPCWRDYSGKGPGFRRPRDSFRALWEAQHGRGSWRPEQRVQVMEVEVIWEAVTGHEQHTGGDEHE